MDILFKNVTAVLMDTACTVLSNAYVGITGSKISYVGQSAPKEAATRVIDGTHKVLLPGFVNAHTHLAMTQLRGYADDYALQAWLDEHIFPAEAKMTDEMCYIGTQLAMMECIASGTVSVTDMYDHMLAVGRVVEESGLKANLTRALMTFDPDYNAASFAADFRQRETLELIDAYHGFDNGRILVDTSIHAEYTSHKGLWEPVAAFALERGLGMNVHVSETKFEHEGCKERYGKTPARVLYEAGVFDVRTTAAHCVWTEPEDWAIFAEKGVTAVHNPVSNLKLASGVAPVPSMLSAGVNVALGTDGVASNNSHDMLEEVKTAALFHKGMSLDPTMMPAPQALRLAVTGGAVAQGRQGEMGEIALGLDADLILMDFDAPHLTPVHNVISNLVYAARGSDICLTLVRGRVLYENGEFLTIDRERVLHENRRIAERFR